MVEKKRILIVDDDMMTCNLIKKVFEKKYDVVAANIVASVIIELPKIVPDMIKPDGMYIMSGIIGERLDEVLAALDGQMLVRRHAGHAAHDVDAELEAQCVDPFDQNA